VTLSPSPSAGSTPWFSNNQVTPYEHQTDTGKQRSVLDGEPLLKVLVVDAHPIMLMGLQSVLQSDPDIALVGACDTGKQALEICAQTPPTFVIMDVLLPDMTGFELCRAIKRVAPGADVLVLTTCEDNASIFGAIGAGASGYVLKDIKPENLLRAIRAVRRGQTMVHPGITRRMLDRLSVISKDGYGGLLFGEKLTGREADILSEVAKGLSNKEIAHKLFISESTVKSRLRSIFTKIEARDRAQAAAFAIRGGYVR
jgi:DNA-binding NarL/FixJ family response regulator